MHPNLIIVGSIAIDDVETPFGRRENSMGGSAIYASLAASKITKTGIIGVVGEDYPQETLEMLKAKGINIDGIEIVPGKTFRWKGKYSDLARAETLDTQLNVFADFKPKLPNWHSQAEYLFLGNIHPILQLDVINEASNVKIIACDTMNFWIDSTPDLLIEVIKKVNILFINEDEILQLTQKSDIEHAAKEIFKYGVQYVIVKRGADGSVGFSKNSSFNVPAVKVDRLVDTTGAGDSFAGGFMGYLANHGKFEEEDIKTAMRYGTATASFNIESFSFDRLCEISVNDICDRLNKSI